MDTGPHGAEVHTDSWDHVSAHTRVCEEGKHAWFPIRIRSLCADSWSGLDDGRHLMLDGLERRFEPDQRAIFAQPHRSGPDTDEREPLRLTIGDPCLDKKRIKDSLFSAVHVAASHSSDRYALPRQSHRRCI